MSSSLRALASVAVWSVACSTPRFEDCALRCSDVNSCPRDLVCNAGYCTRGKSCKAQDVGAGRGTGGRDSGEHAGTGGDVGKGGTGGRGGTGSRGGSRSVTGGRDAGELDSGGQKSGGGTRDELDASIDGRDGRDAASKCTGAFEKGVDRPIQSILGGTWGGITLSSNGLEAYAVRNVTDQPERIYRLTRGAETEEFAVSEEFAGGDADLRLMDPALSPDGLTLYYTVIASGMPLDSADIFVSHRSSPGERFGPGKGSQVLNDANYLDADPFVSYDGTTLYFTSRRNNGNYDIYSWQIGALSSPAPLLSVNTASFTERSPVLTDDGLTIFFSSNRDRSGDIYMTQRSDVMDGFRQEVERLGPTKVDVMEYPEAVSHDGCTLWYTSSRLGLSNIQTTTWGRH